MKKLFLIAAMFFAPLALAGCATLDVAATATANLTSATDIQVTALGDAINGVDLITKAVNVYLALPSTTKAQAQTVLNLSVPVNVELVKLKNDQAQGKTLVFDTLNAAIAALHAAKL